MVMKKKAEEGWEKQTPATHAKFKAKYGENYREAWMGVNVKKDVEEGRWDRLPQ